MAKEPGSFTNKSLTEDSLRNDGRYLVGVDAFIAAGIHRSRHVVVGLPGLHVGVGEADASEKCGINLRVGTSAHRTAIEVIARNRRRTRPPVQRNRVVRLRSDARPTK